MQRQRELQGRKEKRKRTEDGDKDERDGLKAKLRRLREQLGKPDAGKPYGEEKVWEPSSGEGASGWAGHRREVAASGTCLAIEDDPDRSGKRREKRLRRVRRKHRRGSLGSQLLAIAAQARAAATEERQQKTSKKKKDDGLEKVKALVDLLTGGEGTTKKIKKEKKEKRKRRKRGKKGDSSDPGGDRAAAGRAGTTRRRTRTQAARQTTGRPNRSDQPGNRGRSCGCWWITPVQPSTKRPWWRPSEVRRSLASRFLAIHTAVNEGSWQSAQFLEMHPLEATQGAPTSLLLEAKKHGKMIDRSRSNEDWRRRRPAAEGWQGGWKGDSKGKGQGGKGKEGRKGKEQGGGWNKQSNWQGQRWRQTTYWSEKREKPAGGAGKTEKDGKKAE
eukprot:s3595_g10.t1